MLAHSAKRRKRNGSMTLKNASDAGSIHRFLPRSVPSKEKKKKVAGGGGGRKKCESEHHARIIYQVEEVKIKTKAPN